MKRIITMFVIVSLMAMVAIAAQTVVDDDYKFMGLFKMKTLTLTSSAAGTTYKGPLYPDDRVTVTKSANYTALDPNDVGRIILVDTDAVVISLPAVGTGETYTIMNIAPDGTAAIHVDVNSSDRILGGCGFVALDDGDKITNTKATADQGDYVTLSYGSAVGWYITDMCGTWADGG